MARPRPVRARGAFRLETLEPRVLFSADSPLAALVAAPADAPVVVETAAAEAGAPVARAVDAAAPAAARPGELVVVDAGVPRLDALLAGLAVPGGPEVVVLDGGAGDADEALARLGDLLAARANLGAVHLVSHGGAGELELAGVPVTLVDLLAANATVGGWADAFADGADFLIYGCDVAAGQAGRAFVDTLALLTGTDVAASTDLTGAAAVGGDWRLEYARGAVTADVVAGPALRDGYDATLAIRTVTSFDDAGAGTLRQALLDANAGDEIRFSGPGTVRLRSELAEIGVPVTIDATTVAGYAGTPLVTLDGRDAGAYSDGLVLSAGSDGSTVRGLAIVNFSDEGLQLMDSGGHTVQSNFVGTDGANDAGNGDDGVRLMRSADNLIGGPTRAQGNVVSANGGHGISIVGSASVRNVVGNNLIGTDAGGEAALGNDRDGVAMLDGARDNAIGGAAELGNVISGNAGDGVAIVDSGANTVAGNLIGLGADGVAGLGNARHGVRLLGDADANLVGTDGTVGARNVISANGHGIDGGDGVSIDGGTGTGATNNAIAGNLVGTDASGTLGRGNATDGIALYGEASGNTVGGAGALGNTIASSGGNGVRLSGAGATANAVVGNRIGTAVDGTAALNNADSGVLITGGASDNRIGGYADAGLGNLISGNGKNGVLLDGTDTSGNSVAGNRIGTDATGTSALPNGDGVLIRGGAHDNLVGGAFVGHGNTVSGNAFDGVEIRGAGTDRNTVAGNIIGLAEGTGAALGNGGHGVVVADGARDSRIGGDGVALFGNVISGNADSGVLVHGTHGTSGPTSGNLVTGNRIGIDVFGDVARPNGRHGVYIVAGASGNVVGGANAHLGNHVAGNAADGVHVSGATTADNRLENNVVGLDRDGASALPNAHVGVVVDGAPGTVIGGGAGLGNTISGNGNDGVEILNAGSDGALVAGNTIGLGTDGETAIGNGRHGVVLYRDVQGALIGTDGARGAPNTISGNAGAGIVIEGGGGDTRDNTVAGNLVGTDADGRLDRGNRFSGVSILGGAHDNVVGGAGALRNVLSGNGIHGVHLHGAGTSTNTVAGNLIGTDVDGAAALANGQDGVRIDNGADANAIGGDRNAGLGNLISGNGAYGVALVGIGTDDNRLLGNRIGTNAAGDGSLGNGQDGVFVLQGAAGTRIGGSADGEGNLVSGNVAGGIRIDGFGGGTLRDSVVAGNLVGTDATGALALGNGGDGIEIRNGATANTIGGTTPGMGNLVSANGASGILVRGAGSDANRILGNSVGTGADGSADLGNRLSGIVVVDGAVGTVVGGDRAAGAGNLVSGNDGHGIYVSGAPGIATVGTVVQGNRVGTDAAGTAALGNAIHGVVVARDASGTLVGGDGGAGRSNLVSGNAAVGIVVADAASTTVAGNLIGTDLAGTAELGNANDGVRVTSGARDTVVGGTDAASGNTISANGASGVRIEGDDTRRTTVTGNRIGTDVAGGADLGNGAHGVAALDGARTILVGGAGGEGNLISGNAGDGVHVGGTGVTPTREVTIAGNRIGTDADGLVALGNDGAGVRVSDNAHGTLVGGAADGGGNLVSGNASDGVRVDDADDVKIVNNLIGTTADGTAALPNGGAGVRVSGDAERTVVGGAGNGNLVSGNVERGVEIGGDEVLDTLVRANLVGTDADGAAALPNGGEGVLVHDGATGTRIGGDADAGQGNLISGHALGSGVAVNGADTTDTWIQGNRIGTTTDGDASLGNLNGVSVSLATDTHVGGAGAGNLISGSFEDGVLVLGAAGVQVLGNRIGTTGDGLAANPNGRHGIWVVGATDAAIGGAGAGEGNVVSGNAAAGIHVDVDSSGATVAGNTVGLGADGATPLGNGSRGIAVLGAGATVGGAAAGAGNIVSANDGFGVLIDGADGARVLGNTIGLDRDGALDRGNRLSGVVIRDADGVVIGEAGAGNTVSGNGGVGVELGRTGGSSVAGNRVGTSADGMIDVGNDRDGVRIFDDSADNLVGGADPAAANTIRGNGGAGIAVLGAGSTGNALLLNVLVGNDGLGIDIAAVGTDPNDVLDADAGANDRVNRPELERVGTDEAGRAEVDGRVETTPNTDVRMDVYATGPEDGSGHGEAQRHLGSITFRTGDDGTAEGRSPLSATLARGEGVTATPTTLSPDGTPGSTSEFARNVVARELDVAPTITSGDFTVAENTVVAGTVTADDANGDAPLYSVTGGADAALFTIDANAGTLRFASAPDAEAAADADGDGAYEVRVAVTDGWSTAERNVTVTVGDANETDVGQVSDADPAADELAEDAAIASAVGITASAADEDVDDSVTYSLASDADGLFAVDATSGVVTLAGALDAETKRSHDVVVRATSTDGSVSDRTFTVAVIDVDETDVGPVDDADSAADELAEDAPVGSVAGITASAGDSDVDDAVSYSLADDAGGAVRDRRSERGRDARRCAGCRDVDIARDRGPGRLHRRVGLRARVRDRGDGRGRGGRRVGERRRSGGGRAGGRRCDRQPSGHHDVGRRRRRRRLGELLAGRRRRRTVRDRSGERRGDARRCAGCRSHDVARDRGPGDVDGRFDLG